MQEDLLSCIHPLPIKNEYEGQGVKALSLIFMSVSFVGTVSKQHTAPFGSI